MHGIARWDVICSFLLLRGNSQKNHEDVPRYGNDIVPAAHDADAP